MKWIVSIIAWATMAVGFTTALSAIFPAAADPFVNKAIDWNYYRIKYNQFIRCEYYGLFKQYFNNC